MQGQTGRYLQAEEVFDLTGGDENRGACGEPDHHGVRDEVHQESKPRQAHGELNETDHECEGESEAHVIRGPGLREGAATMAGTMAAYNPYCGGIPAMLANATP